jgi:hypothetical protein
LEDGTCAGLFLVTAPADLHDGQGLVIVGVQGENPELISFYLTGYVELLRTRMVNNRADRIQL